MVTLRPVFASALLLLAGCSHLSRAPEMPTHSHASPTSPVMQAPEPERTAISQVYVQGADTLRPAAFADALRSAMIERGFKVRGADGHAPAGADGAAAITIAHTVAEGREPPVTARTLAYLHPNAPRLLLLVDIGATASTARQAIPTIRVGAIFADTADGSILWSSRLEEDAPADDRQLRRLANRLLASLPAPQS